MNASTKLSVGLAIVVLGTGVSLAGENTELSDVQAIDGKAFASFSPNGKIRLTKADGSVRTLDHCAPVAGAFSKDGTLFCAAGRCLGGTGSIKVWRVSDGKTLCRFDNDISEIPKITFSADGRFLACTSGKTRIKLWDLAGETLKWSASVNRSISSLSFDATDAVVVAQCVDKTVRRLSMEDGGIVQQRKTGSELLCQITAAVHKINLGTDLLSW